MQVVVLNGVNLDVLARRYAALYGGMSLSELETRIYDWASVLGCHVRCRRTNHWSEFVDWCHDALDWADGVVVNPGAWTHYSYAIRDALELFDVPIVEVHLSNIEEREEWRRTSVVADLAAKRILGKGAEGYREALEEPLLVTNPTNVQYLFGIKSSNAALLVEPERARLFTDFRYSEAARAVEGVEFEETRRALLVDLADRLSGRVGFEADFVSYTGYETL